MKIKDLLAARDEAIKARFLSVIPPDNAESIRTIGKFLDEAFKQGNKDWGEKYLHILLASDQVEGVQSWLEKGYIASLTGGDNDS